MTPSELQDEFASVTELPQNPDDIRTIKVRKIFNRFEGRMRILDIGCGNGAILKPFAKRHELYGVDIGESFVRLANEAGFKAQRHDLAEGPLPFPDKNFDGVFFGETIEHQVDTDWIVFEVNRILKPGGKLVMTFPNVRTPVSLAMMLFFDLPPMYSARYRSSHYRDFTLRTMKIVLQNHGFRLEKAVGSAFFLPKIGEFGAALASHVPSWSDSIIAVCSKQSDSVYSKSAAANSGIYGTMANMDPRLPKIAK